MFTAKLAKEVTVRVHKSPKVLSNITKLLADKGFDLSAATIWSEGEELVMRFVCDEHVRAIDTLREKELSPEEREVLVVEVPHKPGMLRRISEVLSNEGVGFDHLYATAGEKERKSLVVVATSNDERAMLALRVS